MTSKTWILLVLLFLVGSAGCSDDPADGDGDADGDSDGDSDGDTDGDADGDGDGDADGDGDGDGTCVDDEDCPGSRRCLAGICRMPCTGGACPRTLDCHEGLCVDCLDDLGCTGSGMELCDTDRFICEPRPIVNPVIGVMYHHWWTAGRWEGDRGNYVYEPLLGHYDNSSAAVVAQHVDWSERAGVNTWVLDTWITDRDDWWMEPNTAAVLDGADARGMQFFFLVDGWFEFEGSDGGYDAHAIASRINAKLAPHFDRPGYLHVDGRPVVFFWAAWGRPCAAFDAIRAGIEGTVGPIYMTGNNGETDCWDRVMMYNPYSSNEETHAGQIERQENLWSDMEEELFPWAPTTMPGYDDTHVREGNPPIALDPDFFGESIRTALGHNQFEAPWLFVCSWSEFHEGSNMEPSSDFDEPEVFLDVMHDELTAAGWLP